MARAQTDVGISLAFSATVTPVDSSQDVLTKQFALGREKPYRLCLWRCWYRNSENYDSENVLQYFSSVHKHTGERSFLSLDHAVLSDIGEHFWGVEGILT